MKARESRASRIRQIAREVLHNGVTAMDRVTADDFEYAVRAQLDRLSPKKRQLIQEFLRAPGHTLDPVSVTWALQGKTARRDQTAAANTAVGSIAHRVADGLKVSDVWTGQWWPVIALPSTTAAADFAWKLRPAFAAAARRVFPTTRTGTTALPYEPADALDGLDEPRLLAEPAVLTAHFRRERNRELATAAKEAHGYACQVCDFDFSATYGDRGSGYIEAHHNVPLESYEEDHARRLSPVTDFAVVCANCHRMLHRAPLMTVAQLKALLRKER